MKRGKVILQGLRYLCALIFLSMTGMIYVCAQETPSGSGLQLGIFARDNLTSEEKKWLIENSVIRFSADPDWPPFSFGDIEGRLWGIEAEIIEAVSAKTGLRFEYVPHEKWADVHEALKKRNIHFIAGIARTQEREEHLIFSEKNWNFPVVIITRKDEPFYKSIDSLSQMRLVMPRGHISTEQIKLNYPSIPLIEVDTTAEAIEAVSHHKADVTIENLAAAAYTIRNLRLNNLKVSGLMSYDYSGRFATHKEDPVPPTRKTRFYCRFWIRLSARLIKMTRIKFLINGLPKKSREPISGNEVSKRPEAGDIFFWRFSSFRFFGSFSSINKSMNGKKPKSSLRKLTENWWSQIHRKTAI